MNKFEEMLERLINEDKSGAEELFHEIVVEKSRTIYENLLAEEYDEDDEEEVEETAEEDDEEEVEEGFDLDDFEVAEEDDDEDPMSMGGDETDDLEMDVSMDDEGGDMDMDMDMDSEEDEEIEDRVVDLEDALDDLKAEFEQMMSSEGGEMDADSEEDDEDMDDMDDTDDMDDMDDMDNDDEEKEAFDPTDQVATMREYVEKVTAKMGDDGANKESTVAGPNDMGGTAENIAQDDVENGVEANQGNLKGSALSDQNPKDMNTKNVNKPGSKDATKMKSVSNGHGAEKKGKPENADKSAGSTLNKVSTRSK